MAAIKRRGIKSKVFKSFVKYYCNDNVKPPISLKRYRGLYYFMATGKK
jgi:hypothetical protein